MIKKQKFASLALLLATTTAMSGMPVYALAADTAGEQIVTEGAATDESEESGETFDVIPEDSEPAQDETVEDVTETDISEEEVVDEEAVDEETIDENVADDEAEDENTEEEIAENTDGTSDEALSDVIDAETTTADGEAVVQDPSGVFDSYVLKIKVTYETESGVITAVEDNGTVIDDDTSYDRDDYAKNGRTYRGTYYPGVFDQLVGKTRDEIDDVDAVASATISSNAIKTAVKAAMGDQVENETNMEVLTVTVDGTDYTYYYQDSTNTKALIDGVDVTEDRVEVKVRERYSFKTIGYYYADAEQKLSGKLYGTAAIPYANFYQPEFYGNSGPLYGDYITQPDMVTQPYQITAQVDSGYDAVTSATDRHYGRFTNASYSGAPGNYQINGIITPIQMDADLFVKVLVAEELGEASDVNILKSVVDELIESGVTTVESTTYKIMYADSTLSPLTASSSATALSGNPTVTVKDLNRRGNFLFEIEGLPEEITEDNILGITFKCGTSYSATYALEHLENMWTPDEFAVTTRSGMEDTRGQTISYDRYKTLAPNTVTSITYLLKDNQSYTIDGLSIYLGKNVEESEQPVITSSDEYINNKGADAVLDLSNMPRLMADTKKVELYKSGENGANRTTQANAIRSLEKENATLLTEDVDYTYDSETGNIHINSTDATGAGIYIVVVSDTNESYPYARSYTAFALAEGEDEPEVTEYVYGTADIPYADFYYGELNDVAEVGEMDLDAADPVEEAVYRAENAYDATSSATTSRKTTGFGATYYTENSIGGYDIEGIADVNIRVDKKIYDAAVKAIEDGQTSNNRLLEIIGSMEVIETEEAPAEYKVLYGNGALGKMVTEVDEQADATAVITSNSVWGDYQIDVTATGLPDSNTVLGEILEDSNGNKYGLTHADQIWLQTYELSFCVTEDFVEPHGITRKAKTPHKTLEGATITKITYLVKDGADIIVNTDLKVKKQTDGAISAEDGAYPVTGSTEIAVTSENMPADSAYTLSSVTFGNNLLEEGTDYSFAGENGEGILTVNAGESVGVGSYTLTFTDDEYKDLLVTFILSVDGTAAIENNKLVLSDGIDMVGYLNNITDVKVNGVSKAARRVVLKDVMFTSDGSIVLDAVINALPVFPEDGTYEVEVISTGYPTAIGEVVKSADEPDEPEVQSGWVQDEDGTWFYYNEDGSKATAWKQLGAHWFYFDRTNGAMATGWNQIGGHWYYMSSSGAMVTGWRQIGGHWYYFHETNGNMATGWRQIGGHWYYFDVPNGNMATGWRQIGGNWYYMSESGVMVTGARRIGTKVYRFSGSGVCLNP